MNNPDFANLNFIVALFLGSMMLMSVCFVYVRHRALQLGGIVLSGLGVILVGMSVWKTIEVEVGDKGLIARLQHQVADMKAEVADTKAEVAEVKAIASQSQEAALSLKESINTIALQDALRQQGVYKGPLDGRFDIDIQQSVLEFQKQNSLPLTGTVTPEILEELRLDSIKSFQN